ncbi:MAG: carbohydrate kinase family protein [Clostridia bacterium]|nr:carbohydrate kinase family protein [Clostridia bacterium]
MAKKLLAVGIGVVDMLIKPIDSLDFEVDSHSIDTFLMASGGDTMNVSCNVATLGQQVDMLGVVGNDSFGKFLLNRLAEVGAGNQRMIVRDGATAVSCVFINSNADRTFYGTSNTVTRTLNLDMIDLDMLDEYDFLLYNTVFGMPELLDDQMATLFRTAKEKGCVTATDTGWDRSGKWFEHFEASMPYIDYFLPSIAEASMLAKGCETVEEMADFFLKAGAKNVAIKLGGDGCYFKNAEEEFYMPAYDVKPVDTTGAGDAFVSGFMTGLMLGKSNRECVQMASATGSYACTFIGTTTQAPTMEKLEQFMATTPMKELKK